MNHEDNFEKWMAENGMDYPFLRWALQMGYLNPEDILEAGREYAADLEKIKEVAPKFYNWLNGDIGGGY